MIASFEKSFLFVHVPKTGGTSIRAALQPYLHRADVYWPNKVLASMGVGVNYYWGDYRHVRFRTHDPITKAVELYPASVMSGLYKFAAVRNPWDWLVSYRNYVLSRPRHKRHRRISRMSFEKYLQFAIQRGIGQQSSMLVDTDGRLLVDFVAKFERLADDFQRLSGQLGLQASLPHANRGRSVDYRDFYDRHARQMVEDGFSEDIGRFDYSFDDIGDPELGAPAA